MYGLGSNESTILDVEMARLQKREKELMTQEEGVKNKSDIFEEEVVPLKGSKVKMPKIKEDVFTIRGSQFTASEIRRVMLISEKESDFNPKYFFGVMSMHIMFMFIPFPISLFVMWIFNGFNFTLIRNW